MPYMWVFAVESMSVLNQSISKFHNKIGAAAWQWKYNGQTELLYNISMDMNNDCYNTST